MNLLESERLYSFKIIDVWDENLIQKAVEIYEQGLGQKYISREDLIEFTQDREKYILIGAMVDNDLAGVIIAYPMDIEESEKYGRELYENKVPQIFQDYKIGLIKSVTVERKYRRRGIGTQLIVEAMQRLKNRGCDLFFAVSWVSGLPDSSPSIFEALKFTNAVEIPGYWTEDSVQRAEDGSIIKLNYMCPVDGNNPCDCSAIFYFRKESG